MNNYFNKDMSCEIINLLRLTPLPFMVRLMCRHQALDC